MGKKNLIAIGILFVVLLGSIFITLFLVSSSQDTRSSANTPNSFPTPVITDIPVGAQDGGSTDPGTVENVTVNYPNVNESGEANWLEANCSWDFNENAVTYLLKVTEVDTDTVIIDEEISSDIMLNEFPITSGNTYRCEVSAVNASGVAGVAGVDEQVCETEALAEPTTTPVPTTPIVTTVPPTLIPATPSASIIPTEPPPLPTVPPTGSIGTIATVGLGGVILLLIGGALLFL